MNSKKFLFWIKHDKWYNLKDRERHSQVIYHLNRCMTKPTRKKTLIRLDILSLISQIRLHV